MSRMPTKPISPQKQRIKQSKEVDWNGMITHQSVELKTDEGRKIIIARIDSKGKGTARTGRVMCVIEQLERLEYKPTPLQTLISLVLTSGTYAFHKSCDTRKKRVEMLCHDIASLCFDGKAARIPKLNESLLD
jgi:hypothetical protein